MTTPHVTTSDFSGVLVPRDVEARVLNALVGGAPFAASLTQRPTGTTSVAFPVASPSGFAWVGELEQIPQLDLNDDAYVVALAKIAGLIDVSNELISDSSVNSGAVLEGLLADSLSRQLDLGLLNGTGPGDNQPVGVIAAAPEVTGTTLLDAVSDAVGEIGDAGGTATTFAASATTIAKANAATSTTGELLYPNGFAAAVGLTPVAVPALATPLVYDSSRCYTVLNGLPGAVQVSDQFHFNFDAVTVRIKARVTVAVPVMAKAMRKITVSP
jgi:HK97 family phage major capsid protein